MQRVCHQCTKRWVTEYNSCHGNCPEYIAECQQSKQEKAEISKCKFTRGDYTVPYHRTGHMMRKTMSVEVRGF